MNVKRERLLILALIQILLVGYSAGCRQVPQSSDIRFTEDPTSESDSLSDMSPSSNKTETATSEEPQLKITKTIQIDPLVLSTHPISTEKTKAQIMPIEQGQIDFAIENLAEILGVDVYRVEVINLELVTWPDASLGCPEPGMLYTQVLSAGYRLTLGVDGELYYYNADTRGEIFLCELDDAPIIPGTPIWRRPDISE